MNLSAIRSWSTGILFVSVSLATTPIMAAQPNEQFVPILSYRTGPNAVLGASLYGGWIDYLDMVNRRDGGVNGVKLTWEECETVYKTEQQIECYEKFLKRGTPTMSIMSPGSTASAYALLKRLPIDKVPMLTVGYGRPDASDGRVFPWAFPVITNYWSQSAAKIKYIGIRSGGMDRLRGKKIANLYHGSAYGKETMEMLNLHAKKYGFEVTHIEVPAPFTDQEAQWKQISELKPDWVILRGIGVMTPTAILTAKKYGYPASRMIGVWWSGAEDDVAPAGDAAKGFVSTAFNLSGREFPVIQDIIKHVYNAGGKGAVDDTRRIGLMYYNRGVVYGIISTEAIRTAQERFGKRPLTGEEVRWGLENLSISNLRILKLGGIGLMQPIKLSCYDHEGGGAVRFQRWDGKQWYPMTGWIQSEQAMVRSYVEAKAAEYAAKENIKLRDCQAENAALNAKLEAR